MPSDQPIPKQGGYVWDEHRNTSRVFPVPPDALPAALSALRAIPLELRLWIKDGHPTLTDAQHRERFGEPYVATRSRKVSQ